MKKLLRKLFQKYYPDILVKGSDYKGRKIAGEDILIKNNKKVALIDLVDGKSSTSIINKILSL
jgi:D-beta-D-heptose 7-phosphate kinase/D-beta-D-heptose 1-phosphate adenosyltransferase